MHSKAGFSEQKIQNRHLLCSTSSCSGALWESGGCLTHSLHKRGASVLFQQILEATKALQHSTDSADLIRIGLNLATDWAYKTYSKLIKIDWVFIFCLLTIMSRFIRQKKITLLLYCSTMKFILLLM